MLVEGVFGLGDRQVGFIAGASSIGAVVASIVLASRADSPSADSIMTGLGFAFGVSVMALAWTPNYEIALVVTAVIGTASIGFISLTQATVMRADHRLAWPSDLLSVSAGQRLLAHPLSQVVHEAFELAQVAALEYAVGVGRILGDHRVARVPVRARFRVQPEH